MGRVRFEAFKFRAFTLIELMIVVAIVAILAATAMTGFDRYIKSARLSERDTLISYIVKNQISYYNKPRLATDGMTELETCFLELTTQPSVLQYSWGRYEYPEPFDWEFILPPGVLGAQAFFDDDWDVLGRPTLGDVYFSYEAGGNNSNPGPNPIPICDSDADSPSYIFDEFSIGAVGDLDKDLVMSSYYYSIHLLDDGAMNIFSVEFADSYE